MAWYIGTTTVCMLLTAAMAWGQKQDHVWYFGPTGAGLDFRSCSTTVLLDGNADHTAWEGVTAVSDRTTGSLLFYTTGHKVYNHLRLPMPNGDPVGLSNSLSQMVVVPWPGSAEKYFLILPEMQGGISLMPAHPAAFSLYYAVIDMSLIGGLGNVATKFNVMLTTPHCEFLTAVPHSNGTDFWLVGHLYGNNTFFTYLITESGISGPAAFQEIGPVVVTPQPGSPSASNLDAVGAMRAAPDGRHIAFTTAHNGITCAFDFDPASGLLSNPMQLTLPGGAYGLSYSLDGSKLYVSGRSPVMSNTFEDGALYQFDLSSGAQDAVQNSRTTLHEISGYGGFATLKLGPDGRLYVARVSSDGTSAGDPYLGVVNQPDLQGAACDYQHDGVWLGGSRGSWGLNNSIEYGHQCSDDVFVQETACGTMSISQAAGTRTVTWPCTATFDRITVFATDGRCILDRSLGHGDTQFILNMASSATGVYVITLSGADRSAVQRFVQEP